LEKKREITEEEEEEREREGEKGTKKSLHYL